MQVYESAYRYIGVKRSYLLIAKVYVGGRSSTYLDSYLFFFFFRFRVLNFFSSRSWVARIIMQCSLEVRLEWFRPQGARGDTAICLQPQTGKGHLIYDVIARLNIWTLA